MIVRDEYLLDVVGFFSFKLVGEVISLARLSRVETISVCGPNCIVIKTSLVVIESKTIGNSNP